MDIQPISSEKHSGKTWVRLPSYAFAKSDSACPLVLSELPEAIMSLPVGLLESEGVYTPVAILGLNENQNLFVGPGGNWLGRYLPQAYRYLPFVLLEGSDSNRVLCVDEELGKVNEDSTDGEPFFDDEGEVSETLSNVLQKLNLLATSGKNTQEVCVLLQKQGLIEPWPMQITKNDEAVEVIGLHRINENELNLLSPETLGELRDKGALLFAYAQLLSMRHIENLANMIAGQNPEGKGISNLDLMNFDDVDTLNFDNF
jgi:hypothetical protein